jgi:hypothetical protein
MASRPVTPVWRVFLIGKSARFLGFTLAVVDGLISYKGMRAMQYPQLEAITIALFIAIFQAAISYLLTSGSPIGEELEARFFSDGGVIGVLRRIIGVLLILLTIAFYLADIGTNYAAFMGGDLLPDNRLSDLVRATFAIMAAIALSLGDEILHLLADVTSASSTENERHVIERHGHDNLTLTYQRSCMDSAQRLAQQQGKNDGQQWQPGQDLKPQANTDQRHRHKRT